MRSLIAFTSLAPFLVKVRASIYSFGSEASALEGACQYRVLQALFILWPLLFCSRECISHSIFDGPPVFSIGAIRQEFQSFDDIWFKHKPVAANDMLSFSIFIGVFQDPLYVVLPYLFLWLYWKFS